MHSIPQDRAVIVSDLLDAAFRYYRTHFRTFIGIVAPLQLPFAVGLFLIQWTSAQHSLPDWLVPTDMLIVWPFFGISLLVQCFPPTPLVLGIALIQYVIVQTLIAGALIQAITCRYRGETPSILGAYRCTMRRSLALIPAATALWVIRLLLGVLVLAILGTLSTLLEYMTHSPHLFSIILLLGMLGFLSVFTLFVVRIYASYLLAPQAIILESYRPLAGLDCSRRLMNVSFYRACVLVIPITIFIYLMAAIPGAFAGFVLRSYWDMLSDLELARVQIFVTLVAQLGLIVALPLYYTFLTLLYYETCTSTKERL